LVPGLSLITLEDGPLRIRRSLAQMLASVGAFLAFLAITLTAAGIYGVMAFLVSQRIKEIGIRMALGAARRGVLKAVVLQGPRPGWRRSRRTAARDRRPESSARRAGACRYPRRSPGFPDRAPRAPRPSRHRKV